MNSKSERILKTAIAFFVLVLFSFVVNRFFRIDSFVGDDLVELNDFRTLSFVEFVGRLPRFRPFSNLFVYLELWICRNHMIGVQFYNIFAFALLGFVFYLVLYAMTDKYLLSLFLAVLTVTSRLSWYNSTQILGRMEDICIILVLLIVYVLFRFSKKHHSGFIAWVCLLYALLLLSHERYFIMGIPLVLFFLIRGKKNEKIYGTFGPLVVFALYYLLKIEILKIPFAMDTGGTDPVSIDFFKMILNALTGLGNILQLPLAPDYLVGLPLSSMAWSLQIFTYLVFGGMTLLFLFCCVEIVVLLVHKKYQEAFSLPVFLLVMIAFFLGSVSVAKRIEMRFLYSSFVLLLLFFGISLSSWNITPMKTVVKKGAVAVFSLVLVFHFVMIANAKPFYYIVQDNSWGNVYYREIYRKNAEELKNKKLICIWDEAERTRTNLDLYLKQFDLSYGFEIYNDSEEFDLLSFLNEHTENQIIVRNHNGTIQTISPRDTKLNLSNVWLEGEENEFVGYSETGEITLEFRIPSEVFANMKYHIYINDEEVLRMENFESNQNYQYQISSIEKNRYFKLTIRCEQPYCPADHGQADIRQLAMYVVSLES